MEYTVYGIATNPGTGEEIVIFKEKGTDDTLFLPKEEFKEFFLSPGMDSILYQNNEDVV